MGRRIRESGREEMNGLKNKALIFAVGWLAVWALIALFSPIFFMTEALRIDVSGALQGPSWAHGFGTDALGRDLLARTLCGSSVSLGISVAAVMLALFIGTWLGAIAGYLGGWTEKFLMGLVDVMLCFPVFFLILAVSAVVGPNIFNIFLILALTGWMGTARLVRAEALSLRDREFILAARVLGGGPFWVLRKHLIPNTLRPVVVSGVLGISGAILVEGGLSFLGVGVRPPVPSWGNLLMDGKATLGYGWWMTFFPGLAIFLTVFSLNILGDALNTYLQADQ